MGGGRGKRKKDRVLGIGRENECVCDMDRVREEV